MVVAPITTPQKPDNLTWKKTAKLHLEPYILILPQYVIQFKFWETLQFEVYQKTKT